MRIGDDRPQVRRRTAGDKVLCNAFLFTAVPSAVRHAGATPVYVESTDGFVMDMDDLEKKTRPTSST